jgi:hypothetical protein
MLSRLGQQVKRKLSWYSYGKTAREMHGYNNYRVGMVELDDLKFNEVTSKGQIAMKKYSTIAAGLIAGAALITVASPAMAGHVDVGVNIGVPGIFSPPVYVQPQPVYVQPQPVYVQPRPVYVQARPVYIEREREHEWREREWHARQWREREERREHRGHDHERHEHHGHRGHER